MQTDEDFNIKFVNAVKKHRCLYDKKVPEYRNKDFQEKSWLDIAQETRESVPNCKERWRNLRACLSRYIKQQSSADPQHKPYYLSEHMQFVLPFLKSNNRQPSMGSNFSYDMRTDLSMDIKHSNSDQEDTDEYSESRKFSISQNNRLNDMDLATVNCVPDVHVEIDTPDTEHDVVYMSSDRLMGNERKRLKSDLSGYNDNPDMDFFRSILPDIQSMTAMQKRKFKIGVLELIDDVLTKYSKQSTTSNNSETLNGYWRKS